MLLLKLPILVAIIVYNLVSFSLSLMHTCLAQSFGDTHTHTHTHTELLPGVLTYGVSTVTGV